MTIKKNNFPFYLCSIFFALHILPPEAKAEISGQKLIDGAKLCTSYLQHYEREYGIPAHLLSAIASTESGIYHDRLKMKLPWPWTINAEGKGYFYKSKQEAMAAAHQFKAQGIKSIDVGCMQVNLYHHPDAFSSLSQAFEPKNNIAYAASFLRSLYHEEKSWKKAASNYHSKTPHLGNKYINIVYNSWTKIVDKLRAARLSVPDSSIKGISGMKEEKTFSAAVKPPPKHIVISENKPNPENGNSKVKYIKNISVRNAGEANGKEEIKRNEDKIIVISPKINVVSNDVAIGESQPVIKDIAISKTSGKITSEQIVVANSKHIENNANIMNLSPSAGVDSIFDDSKTNSASGAKIIRLDNKLVDRRAVNIEKSRRDEPRFIFDN